MSPRAGGISAHIGQNGGKSIHSDPGRKEGGYAGESLPWPSELIEVAGKVRSEGKGVSLLLECTALKTPEGGPPYGDGDADAPLLLAAPAVCETAAANLQTPLFENGTQIGGPLTSRLLFDAESGKLLCKGPGEKEGEVITFEAKVSGKLKVMGFGGQELILAK
jgi:hypothetical protein